MTKTKASDVEATNREMLSLFKELAFFAIGDKEKKIARAIRALIKKYAPDEPEKGGKK